MERSTGRRAWVPVAALAAVGLFSRVAPLFDVGGRLLRQFPTEDGYLMLTMARNIALGHGMSIADGTIPTNGTQPLATYLFAGAFWLVDGARKPGVALVLLLEIALAVASALLLYRLGRELFGERRLAGGPTLAAVAAGAWFASPVVVRHSMNVLETGVYGLTIVASAFAFVRLVSPGRDTGARLVGWAALGGLLGLAFWARNDAVLLCGALGVAHLLGTGASARPPLRSRILQLAVAGVATGLVAAPWLANNLLRFGSLMPVSGHAESMRVALFENLALVGPKLFEYATLVLLIPSGLETRAPVVLGSFAFVAAAAALGVYVLRGACPRVRSLALLAALYGLALALFYGVWFGAGHFMSRYLFPTSPFAALLLTATVAAAAERAPEPLRHRAAAAGAAVFLLLALGLNARIYARGDVHAHFQVVRWVERHVPEHAWVGAIQTGTLGFFHDRTINLDGKVNPAALRARNAQRIPEYVVESEIDYLVDWVGIAGWIEKPPLGEHFELHLEDPRENLAVLRRKGAPIRRAEASGG